MSSAYKRYGLAAMLVACGLASIGISSWQFQVKDNGVDFTTESLKEICSHFPYNWLRPFAFTIDNTSDSVYCGYSEGNTGYRLAIAILTIFGGIGMAVDKEDAFQKIAYWGLFGSSVLWYAATVIDIMALVQGSKGCTESWESEGTGITCDSSAYGITIALDFVLSILMCLAWLFQGMGVKDDAFSSLLASPE